MRAQQTESSAHRSSLRKATALRSFLLTSTSIVTLSMAAAVPQAKAQTNTTSSQWTVPAAGAGGVNGNDPLFGDTTYPGMGGTGGTVNTTNQAAISVNGTANGMPAIWINAPGGVGGNAAQADSLITQTQSGATGGTGGQITFTNSAPLTSTDSQTIWLFARRRERRHFTPYRPKHCRNGRPRRSDYSNNQFDAQREQPEFILRMRIGFVRCCRRRGWWLRA